MADENRAVIPAGTPIIINAVPQAAQGQGEPPQLREGRERREAELAEAREAGAKELLKSLGVKKSERARLIEEVRAGRMKIAEVKETAVAANQAAAQIDAAAQAQADAVKPLNDRLEAATAALKKYADAEFAALPENFQKAIVEMKLDDPQRRLEAIEVFKKTGLLSAAVGAAAAAPVAKKDDAAPAAPTSEQRKPATTMAAPAQPASPTGASMNYYQQWKAMTDRGEHWLAAQFLHANRVKILEQRPQNS